MDVSPTTRLKSEPNWLFRRSNVFLIQSVCAGILLFLTFRGQDTRLNETLANGAYMLWGTIAIGYIFGVIVDDKFQISERKRYYSSPHTRHTEERGEDSLDPLPPKDFAG